MKCTAQALLNRYSNFQGLPPGVSGSIRSERTKRIVDGGGFNPGGGGGGGGTVTDSTTPTLQIAQINDTGGSLPLYNGNRFYPAWKFPTIGAFRLTSIDMLMGRFSAETGTVTARILAVSGGVPISTLIAESTNSINITTLTNAGYPDGRTPVTFTFNNVLLQALTTYALEIHSTNFAGVAITVIMLNSNTYPLITMYSSADAGATWTATWPNYCAYFKMYGYGVGSGTKSGDCSVTITGGGGDSFECCVVDTDINVNTGGGTGFSGEWIRS